MVSGIVSVALICHVRMTPRAGELAREGLILGSEVNRGGFVRRHYTTPYAPEKKALRKA